MKRKTSIQQIKQRGRQIRKIKQIAWKVAVLLGIMIIYLILHTPSEIAEPPAASLIESSIDLITAHLNQLEPELPEPDKFIAITFDDGPGPYTDRLLNELQNRDIKATFFVLGSRTELYPELTKKIAEEGHEIGTHSQTHAKLSGDDYNETKIELKQSISHITEKTGGVRPKHLRPPGGYYDETLQALCAESGLPIIMWSLDTKDWQSRNVQSILDAAFEHNTIEDGTIILLHDIYETSVDASLIMIDRLLEEGYGFKTVSDLLESRTGTLIPGEIYYGPGH